MKKILALFVDNRVFANITLIAILITGCIAAMSMVRETFPEFSLDMISVSVAYPGADPEEIEEGISRKIEEAIDNIDGIEQYNTLSREGYCLANIEVKRGYETREIIDNVRTKVNSISTFPDGAERPVVKELMLQDPVLVLYLSGEISEKAMKELSYQIKDEIQELPDVSQVRIFGDREYEIYVEVSEKKLRKYDISLLDIADLIRKNNLNLAAGKIRSQQEEIRIRTIGRKYTGEELASTLVLTTKTGGAVPLSQLAKIKDGFSEEGIEARINGDLASIIIVYKTKGEDSLAISNALSKYIFEKKCTLSKNLNFDILHDNTEMLRDRVNLLLKNGFIGLIIVFLFLWIFLNARLSFWAGMGILVSISGALTILWLLGGTVNMVSLFGLIMVLGIVVDDAVVIGEAIYFNRQRGDNAFSAAVGGVCEVGVPVLTAVATSIVAFIPLFFINGIMGKFILILPMVVIACLVVSLIESLFLLPAHLNYTPGNNIKNKKSNFVILKINKGRELIAAKMNWFISDVYTPFLSKVLYWRYVSFSIAIAVFLLAVGVFRGELLKFEVFPALDGFVMTATVEFPDGTPLSVTKKAIKRIDSSLVSLSEKTHTKNSEDLIQSRLSIVGETLDQMPKVGSHFGSVQAILLESDKRGIHSDDLMILWEKEIGNISGAKSIKFEGLSTGPPGAPIEIWVQGYDIGILSNVAGDLMSRLEKFEGVYQVVSDFSYGKNELHLKLKPEGRYLGLTVENLARQVNAAYYGVEALRIQRGCNDIKIKVCYPVNERNQIADIERMMIRTGEGDFVHLTSVADISFVPGYSSITRTNGIRRISVSAGVDTNVANTNKIFSELSKNYFPELLKKYPGISVSFQGEQKKMKESLGSLLIGFPMAILGIFIILATIFRSYLQPVVIMFTIPFGIIGAVIGHLVLGYDVSIMSIFGMVALTGIVVNAAIVLIERVNGNLAMGLTFFPAIIQAGTRRFMAIFLTTISTVGGLMPIVLETDFQAKVLIPMAISIAFGVAFASILTLILVPSLLAILSDIRVIANKLKCGKWEKRELLEPARNRYINLGKK